jgi:anti-sigma-K factor RskA
MTDERHTTGKEPLPSDEELFDYVQGTLSQARRAEVAQAMERDPDLQKIVADAQAGLGAVNSYSGARMPMDSAVALHRALGAEWLEREEHEHQKSSSRRQRSVKPKPPSHRKAQRSSGRTWWKSPGLRVAISFAVVALVAGVALTGLRSATGGSDSSSPALTEAPEQQSGRAAESPAADAATEKAVQDTAPPSTADESAIPDDATAGATSSGSPTSDVPPSGAPASEAPSADADGSENLGPATPADQGEVLCVFVSSSVPIPVAGPANPVLGEVKRSISADFTIAPYRIDCKF